jgi:Uncharacterized protein conserved in bacteria (DUF2188)
MGSRNIHTVPSGNKWAVKKEGTEKPLSTHNTKAAVLEKGVAAAKKAQVEHVIHGKDGRIQDKDSYGNDPCPPKDKKH